jgi:(R,R)-butanediol dehydrogenase / meso-butanediol dehydrogenase / diacetyl reductase
MATMKSVRTGPVGKIDVVDTERPTPGPRDALLKIRACGICGTDTFFLHLGGTPMGPDGSMVSLPLGHEPAGEIVAVGPEVTGLTVGDRVVVNPQGVPSGIIGCGGKHGAMSEYLLIEDAAPGTNLTVVPDTLPYAVAALNEPLAVARHCVNRSNAQPTDKVVVFGAGPIGLGATIWLKLRGVAHVTVVDVLPERLHTALAVGADAVVKSPPPTTSPPASPPCTARPPTRWASPAPAPTSTSTPPAPRPSSRPPSTTPNGAPPSSWSPSRRSPTPSTWAACCAANSP